MYNSMLVKKHVYRNSAIYKTYKLYMQCDHRRQQDDLSCVVDNFTSSSSTLESELSKSFCDLVELAGNRIALLSDV